MKEPYYNREKLSELIRQNGWNANSLANATEELDEKYSGNGITKSTAQRIINCEGTSELRTINLVLEALAKKIGHNDIEKIKEEIEYQINPISQIEKSKSKWNSDNIVPLIAVFLILFQIFAVVFKLANNFEFIGVVLPIFIVIVSLLFVKKINYRNSLLILSIFVFVGLTLLIKSKYLDKSFSIQNIQIVENQCLWENEFAKKGEIKTIIGFSEKTKNVWERWRTIPKIKGKDLHYDNTPMDNSVKIVTDILKKELENQNFLKSENRLFKDCNDCYSIISGSNYKIVLKKLVESYRQKNNLIECIKSIWPSNKQLDFYNRTDTISWNALEYFQNDFFREKYPIFEIEIKNESEGEILLEKTSVEMTDLQIDMFPKDYAGGYPLEKIADYELTLTNLKNPNYIKFLEDSINAHPYGYKATYNGELDISYLDLKPKLIIKGGGTVLIYLRIKGGYRWPCKIKFSFYDSNQNRIESSWYNFNVTSNPLINLYKYDDQNN